MRTPHPFLFALLLSLWLPASLAMAAWEKAPLADPREPTFPLRFEEWTWEGTLDNEPATLTMRGWTNKDGSFVGSGVCTQQGRSPRRVSGGIFALWWVSGMRLRECPPGEAQCHNWYAHVGWETPTDYRAHDGYIDSAPWGQEPTFAFRLIRQTPLPPPVPAPVRPLPVPPQHFANKTQHWAPNSMPGLAEQLVGMLSPEHYEGIAGFSSDKDPACFMGSQGNLLCAGHSSGWVTHPVALAVSPQGRVDVLIFDAGWPTCPIAWHYTNDTENIDRMPGDIEEAVRLWELHPSDGDPMHPATPWLHFGPLSTQHSPLANPVSPVMPVRVEQRSWTGTANGTAVTVTMHGQADEEGRFTGSGFSTRQGQPPVAIAGGIFSQWWPSARGMRLWECAGQGDNCIQWEADAFDTQCSRAGFTQQSPSLKELPFRLCRAELTPEQESAASSITPPFLTPLPVRLREFQKFFYHDQLLEIPGFAQRLAAMLPPAVYELVSTMSMLPLDPNRKESPTGGHPGDCLGDRSGAVCAGESEQRPEINMALFVSPKGRLDVLVHTAPGNPIPRAWHYTNDTANAATFTGYMNKHLPKVLRLWGVPRGTKIPWVHVSALLAAEGELPTRTDAMPSGEKRDTAP